MKIELVQKMSMEIVSTEPLEVRISMIAECGEEAISFEKTIKAIEEFAQFTVNASSWMEQFCAGKATTFIKDRFFGVKMKNQQLKAFMEENRIQQKQMSQMLGVSVATVSLYLRGEYNGDVSEIDRKVDEMFERQKAKVVEAKYNAEFVPTLAAKQGMEVMRFAHVEGEINVIFGAAGLGKTQMLKEYARKNSSAILIEVDPSCTPKVLLRKIAEAVGATARGVNNELLDSIVSKLKGSERLLMVDEAELLSTRSLEFIRRIHDLTGVGVVLAGMPRLLVNLKGKNNELAQLYSRVGFACDLGNALPDDDLALLAESALGTDEFNAPLIKACKGNARRLSKLMRGVVRSSEINNVPISAELVERYAGMLIS